MLKNLSLEKIREYLKKIHESEKSDDYVVLKIQGLKKFLSWAYQKELIDPNFFQQINKEIDKNLNQKKEFFVLKKINSFLKKIIPAKRPSATYEVGGGALEGFGIRHFLGFSLILLFMAAMGAGIYQQFFQKTETPLAYPSTPVRAGRVISFQARLTDSVGNPINTATNVQFRLWKVSTGGTEGTCAGLTGEDCLYKTGVCSITPDADGIFSTLIGEDCGAEIPNSVFTENAEVYLGVTVGTDNEMTPRQQIANVAYAINAETLQGLPPGTGTSSIPYINKDGNLLMAVANPGIRSTFESANFNLSSAKNLTLTAAGTGEISLQATGSGDLKFKTGWDGSNSYTRMTITNLGNVGIGTTNPGSYQLNVDGSQYISNNLTTGGTITSGSNLYLPDGSASLPALSFTNDTDTGLYLLGSNKIGLITGGSTTSGITIDNGNVGIGTTSPSQKLHISGNMRLTGAFYDVNNDPGTSGQILSSTATGVDWIDPSSLSINPRWSSLTDPIANLTLNHSTYTTTFNSSATTETFFTINANSLTSGKGLYLSSTSTGLTGNLAEFVLSGSNASNTGNVLRVAQTGTSSSAVPLMVTNLGTGLSFRVNDETGDNDSTPFIIDASGNVGIGNPSPSYKLDVSGTIRGDYFIDSSNVNYGIDPAGTSNFGGYSLKITGGALLAADSGNVGIGTTSPSQKLSVAGTLGIIETGVSPQYYTIFQGGDQSGNITYTLPTGVVSGGVLTTDALGVLSWSTPTVKWNNIANPDNHLTLNHSAWTTTMSWTSTGALNAWTMNLYNNSTSATTQNFVTLNNALVGSFTDTTTENLLLIQQLDTTATGTTVVDNALKIDAAGSSGINDGIEITNSAGNITNGINLIDTTGGTFTTGINFSGTFTNLISAPNFSVNNAGTVTIAAGQSYTGSGAVTLSSGGTGALTLNSGSGLIVLNNNLFFEKGTNDLTLAVTAPTGASRTLTIPALGADGNLAVYSGALANGDILFGSTSNVMTRLTIGGVNTVLISNGSAPTWSTIGASSITADSLDFTEFQDTLDLDANLVLNQTTFSWTQSFTGTTTNALIYNINSLTTGTGLQLNLNALTSGKGFLISSSSTGLTGNLAEISLTGNNAANTGNLLKLSIGGASTNAVPLMITNLGTGLSFRVNDETGDSDTTPFVIDDSGNVGIGTAAPSAKLEVAGNTVLGNSSTTTTTIKGYLFRGLAIRFTRSTANPTDTDATKNSRCSSDFGSAYRAASAAEVAMNANGAGTRTVVHYFVVAGETTYGYYFQTNTTKNEVVLQGTSSLTNISVACIRQDAPLLTSNNTVSASASDSTKDNACPTTHRAANLSEVAAYSANIGITAPSTPFPFNVAGITSNSFIFRWDNTNNISNIQSITAGTYKVACIMRDPAVGNDYAETIAASESNLQPGDILTLDQNNQETVKKSTKAYDEMLVGVVPSQPGMVIGEELPKDKGTVIALSGRVPVKVTTKNGPIKIGDYITSSDIPGVGMKATQSGRVLGVAMSEYTNPNSNQIGLATVFVNPHWKEFPNHENNQFSQNEENIANYLSKLQTYLNDKILFLIQKTIKELLEPIYQSLTIIEQKIASKTIISPIIENEEIQIKTPVAKLKTTATKSKIEIIDNQNQSIAEFKTDEKETTLTGSVEIKSDENKGKLARLILKSMEGRQTVSIDALGNASFSGTLTSSSIISDQGNLKNLSVSENATISGSLAAAEASLAGKLVAKEIEAENINQLTSQLANQQTNINEIQKLLADLKNQPLSNPENQTNLSTTANLSDLSTLSNLTVTNQTNLYNVSVANSLVVGNLLLENDRILSLTWELRLSALSKINFFDGAVVIAKDGTITTKGELIAQGGVKTNEISILRSDPTKEDPTLLKIKNPEGEEIAHFDASGSAYFKKLSLEKFTPATPEATIIAASDNFKKNGVFVPAIETNTSSAGVGILPENQLEIIIYNNNVKEDSLIYLTPQGTYPTKLTVSEKKNGYFKVIGESTIHPEIKFDWLIIN